MSEVKMDLSAVARITEANTEQIGKITYSIELFRNATWLTDEAKKRIVSDLGIVREDLAILAGRAARSYRMARPKLASAWPIPTRSSNASLPRRKKAK